MTFHDGDLNRFPTSHRSSRSRVTHTYNPWQGLFHIMSFERTRREGFPGDQPTEEFRKASDFTSSGETGPLPTEPPTYRLPLNLKEAHFGDNLGPKGLAAKGLRGVHAPVQKVPTHLPGKCAAWRKLRLLLGLTSQQPVHQTCVYSLNGTLASSSVA